jgi:hypothetical protein
MNDVEGYFQPMTAAHFDEQLAAKLLLESGCQCPLWRWSGNSSEDSSQS